MRHTLDRPSHSDRITLEILAKFIPKKPSTSLTTSNFAYRAKAYRYHRSYSFRPQSLPSYSTLLQNEKIDKVISRSWATSTSRKYSNAVEHFFRFCDSLDIPLYSRLPASEYILCAFVADSAGKIAGGTISSKISAIKAWHTQNNQFWNGRQRLKAVLTGAEKMTPDSSRRPERPPVTIQMITMLYHDLDHNNTLDVAIYFAACCAFWCQIRLGELFPENQRTFNSKHAPALHHLFSPIASGSRRLHLPRTKIAGEKGEDVMMLRQLDKDPIAALQHHVTSNSLTSNDPLCSYRDLKNKLIPLTKRKFLLRCNEIWFSRGLIIPTTGHAFRIGGTTHLLISGVPPHIVKMMGRWSSDEFLKYWRSLEIIAPLYAELLKPLEYQILA